MIPWCGVVCDRTAHACALVYLVGTTASTMYQSKGGTPHWPTPNPHTDRSGGGPWSQLALQDQNPWPSAPAGPPTWTKKELKRFAAEQRQGKGATGKEGKGKGKKGKGKKGKGKKGWDQFAWPDDKKAQAKAAAAKWGDWRSENGGK